ncbi:PKD-like family lipoprotein [Gabonibacter chumensis]|uniref:PKD-like family lipoprotein n=1 Tax=Gabonibacter chumensis TaxID=2972474 RepID=UPI0025732224|nr:PKD-like family lipoprotein [Gabonibacter chumensis]MCR9013212.1 PKD-like family lipoprotein [Gabonibacter chumensis]
MKWNKLIYVTLFTLFLFSACYEDKGNYDYKDMEKNKVTVLFKSWTAKPYYGEPAIFTPKLRLDNPNADTNVLKFNYYFGKYGCVCSEKNMSYVFEGETGSVEGILIVTDTTTGMMWSSNIGVSYQSPYGTGWFILSDENGKSRVNMVRVRNDEYITDQRLYSTLWGGDLGTRPHRILLNKKGIKWGEPYELRILQDGPEGSVSLDPKDLKLTKTLKSEFVGEMLPDAGFKAEGFAFGDCCGVVIGQDGNVYTRIYDRNKLNYSSFVAIPMEYKKQKVNAQYLLNDHPKGEMYDMILYDKTQGAFMIVKGGSLSSAGGTSVVTAPETLPTGVPSPANLYAYENLYSQLYNTGYNGVASVFSLIKDKDGKVFVYSFAGPLLGECKELTKKEFKASALLSETSVWHRLRTRPYLFIGKGKELYYYDLNTSMLYPYRLSTGFAGNITSIESDYSQKDNVLAVGLDSGDFYLLDVSEKAFVAPELPEPIYQTRVPGKIVDHFYKQY